MIERMEGVLEYDRYISTRNRENRVGEKSTLGGVQVVIRDTNGRIGGSEMEDDIGKFAVSGMNEDGEKLIVMQFLSVENTNVY